MSTSKTRSKDTHKSEPVNALSKIGTKSKSVGWYAPSLTYLSPEAVALFEHYSQIAGSDLTDHILSIRDKAWAIHPFPFIGLLHFTNLSLSQTPSYNHILTTLTNTPSIKILDLGCGLGQDLRKLLYDGAPASSLYGLDSKKDLITLGHDLFNDKTTWGGKMITSDLFEKDPTKNKIKKYEGKFDFVSLGLFLHLFDLKTQQKALEKVVKLLKDQNDVMVVGHQIGNLKAVEVESSKGRRSYRHDVESFEALWREVGRKTKSEWRVWAWLEEEGQVKEWDEEGTRKLCFEVVRVG